MSATRIFISTPIDQHLSSTQREIKRRILQEVTQQRFEPQIIGEAGIPANTGFIFSEPGEIMRRCQGAIILGLARWECADENYGYRFITEYSHYEGALALERNLPTLIIKEDGIMERGILFSGERQFINYMPPNADETWVDTDEFKRRFNGWCEEVKKRRHVFFGYSGKREDTANKIIRFLESEGVSVLDWKLSFQLGGTILDQIKRAEQLCLGGIFLFTKDDELVSGNVVQAAPRDNVIFEAGYFISTKGDERVLIILEEGAKMPADLGGQIYLPLSDLTNTSTIETRLRRFIQDRL